MKSAASFFLLVAVLSRATGGADACVGAINPQCSGCATDTNPGCPSGTADCCASPTTNNAYTCYQYHDSGYLAGGSFILPTGGSYPGCPANFGNTGTCKNCVSTSFLGFCTKEGYRRTCRRTWNCPAVRNGGCATCADRFYKSGSSCLTCPAGSKCTGGGKATCPSGTFSAAGANSCSACAPGTFSASGGAANGCTSCTGNKYVPTGATACVPCPDGSKCSNGQMTSCETGEYFNSQDTCVACEQGYKCNGGEKTACSAPKYQTLGKQTTCETCAEAPTDKFRQSCGGSGVGTLQDCTQSCIADKYLTGRCAGGAVSNTASCASCATYASTNCQEGQFLNGCGGGNANVNTGTCSPCVNALESVDAARACAAGTYLTGHCNKGALKDDSKCLECQKCSTTVVDGKEVKSYVKDCGGLSAGTCATCQTCDATQNLVGCGGSKDPSNPGNCATVCRRIGRDAKAGPNSTVPVGKKYFEVFPATTEDGKFVDTSCMPCSNFTSAAELMINGTIKTDASQQWMSSCYVAPPSGAIEDYCDSLGLEVGSCIGANVGVFAFVVGLGIAACIYKNKQRKAQMHNMQSAHHAEMSDMDGMLDAATNMSHNPLMFPEGAGDAKAVELAAMSKKVTAQNSQMKAMADELRRMKLDKAKAGANETSIRQTGGMVNPAANQRKAKKEFGQTRLSQ